MVTKHCSFIASWFKPRNFGAVPSDPLQHPEKLLGIDIVQHSSSVAQKRVGCARKPSHVSTYLRENKNTKSKQLQTTKSKQPCNPPQPVNQGASSIGSRSASFTKISGQILGRRQWPHKAWKIWVENIKQWLIVFRCFSYSVQFS